MQPKSPRFLTGHHLPCETLLFDDEQEQFEVGHLLDGLWSRPVDLTAYPVAFGVGVDAEFDGLLRYN